ncbi:hypothetical protein BDZ97DRAFT_1729354 [Flammula alnicola]|nr:hypothetical protein BDZ97DRAFT_1729354 [Flammula alnicola]
MDNDRPQDQSQNDSLRLIQTESTQAVLETPTHPEQRQGVSAVNVEDMAPESILINTASGSRRITRSLSTAGNDDEGIPSPSGNPLPPIPQQISPLGARIEHPDPRLRSLSVHRNGSLAPPSGIDWIVPRSEKEARERTVGERLEPTLSTARREKDQYAFKAKVTAYALNAAIGMQVILGALTTGLAVVTTGHQTQIATAVLGGFATIVASYLARARGSNEPELSIARVKDLEQFIRECQAFIMDHGHVLGDKYDDDLRRFRDRFEELLGNANGCVSLNLL